MYDLKNSRKDLGLEKDSLRFRTELLEFMHKYNQGQTDPAGGAGDPAQSKKE